MLKDSFQFRKIKVEKICKSNEQIYSIYLSQNISQPRIEWCQIHRNGTSKLCEFIWKQRLLDAQICVSTTDDFNRSNSFKSNNFEESHNKDTEKKHSSKREIFN